MTGGGRLLHEGSVCVRLGPAQPVVEVSNVQAQRQVRCESMQHVQQTQRVRTAGDAYDYGVSGIDQLVALNGVLHFGYQGH